MQSSNQIEPNINQSSAIQTFQLLLEILYQKINILSKDLTIDPTADALIDPKPVLRIDLKKKSHKFDLLYPYSKIIHVTDHHPLLSMIVINEFSGKEAGTTLPKLEVTLAFKKAESQKYFIRDETIIKLMVELYELASKINLVEYKILKCRLKSIEKEVGVFPLNEWDGGWDDSDIEGGQYDYYDELNDPHVIEKFNTQVLSSIDQLKENEPLTILDIGAGKGRLAFKLILLALEKNISIHYIFVEPSFIQMMSAKELFKACGFFSNEKLKITFIASTLEKLVLNNKAHCIISSGGPLNLQIVPRSSALENVKIIKQLLLPDGIFIGTGLTAFLVNSKHFKKAGLLPLSYSIPTSPIQKQYPELEIKRTHRFFQCYVMKNSSQKVEELTQSQARVGMY